LKIVLPGGRRGALARPLGRAPAHLGNRALPNGRANAPVNEMTFTAYSRKALGIAALFAVLLLVLPGAACRKPGAATNGPGPGGVIVVNAPASGQVKRILVAEGVRVNAGAPVIEIAVRNEAALGEQKPGESRESQAVRDYKAADAEIEAARADAVRHGAEVDRLTPLVASGQVSSAELDGERALYEKAQRRLQQAQEAKKNAETGLIAARQPNQNQNTNTTMPREEVVSAVATSAGVVTVIGVRVGDQVKAGQPLATLRGD
jgi:multidrug efflux pump subunit AcrA (membrane-fusion protein)